MYIVYIYQKKDSANKGSKLKFYLNDSVKFYFEEQIKLGTIKATTFTKENGVEYLIETEDKKNYWIQEDKIRKY